MDNQIIHATYRGMDVIVVDSDSYDERLARNVLVKTADNSRVFVHQSHVGGTYSYVRTDWDWVPLNHIHHVFLSNVPILIHDIIIPKLVTV